MYSVFLLEVILIYFWLGWDLFDDRLASISFNLRNHILQCSFSIPFLYFLFIPFLFGLGQCWVLCFQSTLNATWGSMITNRCTLDCLSLNWVIFILSFIWFGRSLYYSDLAGPSNSSFSCKKLLKWRCMKSSEPG